MSDGQTVRTTASGSGGGIEALDHVQPAAPPGSEDALRAYCTGVLGMTGIAKPPTS